MIIKRLCLEDFGIFRNQILDNLHGGLVVIAGCNRAGKSTLMTGLRYLGYGFPKRPSIPPSSGAQQIISADALLHTGEKYNIKLEGHSVPKVSPLDNSSDTTIDEIYGGVDGYTYRQVFTISLEELKRIPEDPDCQGEQHLQAILLGGGWSDALKLMHIRREFGKEANDIAGKAGSKGTGQFKPFARTIAGALELREEANSQIEQFHALKTDIAREKADLANLENALIKLDGKLELHELVRDHYATYQELVRLEGILEQEQNKTLLENYPMDGLSRSERLLEDFSEAYRNHEFLQNRFAANIGTEKQEILLENAGTLDIYAREVSGWREKATALEANLHEHQETREELAAELAELHSSWGKDLGLLNTLPLDLLNEEQILKLVDNVSETDELLKACTRDIQQNTLSLENKEAQAETFSQRKAGIPKKIAVLSALGLVLVLLTSNLIGPGAAAGTGLVAGAGIVGYILHNYLGSAASRRELIISQVEDIKSELEVLNKQQQDLQQAIMEGNLELRNVLGTLHLPGDMPYSAVPDFIRGVKSLRKRYNSWLVKDKQISAQQEEQQVLLSRLQILLDKLGLATGAYSAQTGAVPYNSGAPSQVGAHPSQSGAANFEGEDFLAQVGAHLAQTGASPLQAADYASESGASPSQTGTPPFQTGTSPQSRANPSQAGDSPFHLFNAVETAYSNLSAAQELKTSELGVHKLEEEILRLLKDAQQLAPPMEGTESAPGAPRDSATPLAPGDSFSPLAPGAAGAPEAPVAREAPLTPGDDFTGCIQALQTLKDKGHLFQELKQQQQKLVALETGLLQTLNTPKNKELLDAPHDAASQNLLQLFGMASTSFSAQEKAAASCQQLTEEKQNLKADITDIVNKIPVMKSKLVQLASEDKLLEAGREIAEARQGLELKAEEYAVNRLAELITKDLYQQLIQETKTTVLGTASDLFGQITSGDYASIDLMEDEKDKDFVACPSGKTRGLPTRALSRGTVEQLFLAVRLSRIRGINPRLPVILDDALANFDPSHTRETVRLIADLAATNQVFVLTCHPELIEWIADTGCEAQYWGLEKGVFTGPFVEPEQVMDWLC